jgi:hypothetical protein
MSATADKRDTMPTREALAVTDADGNRLEAKFAASSKQFTYRDEATNRIKRARPEKGKPLVIATTATVAEVEAEPANEAAPEPEPTTLTPIAVEPATEPDDKKAVSDTDTLPAPEPYITTLTDAECKDMTEYFTALAIEGGASIDTARAKARQDLQDCFTLAYFTDTERAAFVEAVAKAMSEGATRRDAETSTFFALLFPTPAPEQEAQPAEPPFTTAANIDVAPPPRSAGFLAGSTTTDIDDAQAAPEPPPAQLPAAHAPETAPEARQGRDALTHYTEYGIKLIPCIPTDETRKNYRPIVKKENLDRVATADINTIGEYMRGGTRWTGRDATTGADLREPINLFRFIPKDCGLVCIDIDRGHSDGADGVQGFYDWLEEAGITKPQLPTYLQELDRYPCHTKSPSGGLHLYFKVSIPKTRAILDELERTGKLKKNLATGVEVFYGQPFTAAGSSKRNGGYLLSGNIGASEELPGMVLKRLQKEDKPQPAPQPPRRATQHTHTQSYERVNTESYKPFLRDYLRAKGIEPNAEGKISCLCHNDGATPNMQVNDTYLYCFSCDNRLDIFGAAAILAGIGDEKRDFHKVTEEVKNTIGVK